MLSRRESAFVKLVDEELKARREDICRGGLSPQEYSDMCGFVRGLKWSLDNLEDVIRKEEGN